MWDCGTQLGAGDRRLAALPLSPETFEALCAQRKSRVVPWRVAAEAGRVAPALFGAARSGASRRL